MVWSGGRICGVVMVEETRRCILAHLTGMRNEVKWMAISICYYVMCLQTAPEGNRHKQVDTWFYEIGRAHV